MTGGAGRRSVPRPWDRLERAFGRSLPAGRPRACGRPELTHRPRAASRCRASINVSSRSWRTAVARGRMRATHSCADRICSAPIRNAGSRHGAAGIVRQRRDEGFRPTHITDTECELRVERIHLMQERRAGRERKDVPGALDRCRRRLPFTPRMPHACEAEQREQRVRNAHSLRTAQALLESLLGGLDLIVLEIQHRQGDGGRRPRRDGRARRPASPTASALSAYSDAKRKFPAANSFKRAAAAQHRE